MFERLCSYIANKLFLHFITSIKKHYFYSVEMVGSRAHLLPCWSTDKVCGDPASKTQFL